MDEYKIPQLLFLPGASGSIEFWYPLIKKLPEKYSKQILAYPGFGHEPNHSDVCSFEQLTTYVLKQIDKPSILIAQSMGGIFAMAAALQKPELVKGLVFIATSGGIDLAPFQVADWRKGYAKEFLHYPDWFLQANTRYDDQLDQIRPPVLLLWGDSDPISPVAIGRHLCQKLANARLHIIDGGEHHFANTHATQVAKYILQYIDDIN